MARVERCVVRLADDAAGRIQLGKALGEHREFSKILERSLVALVASAYERRTVHPTEDHRVAADVNVVLWVARLDIELAWGFGDLFHDELRIKPDRLTLDLLACLGEELGRFWLDELDAYLGHDASPAPIEDFNGVGREQFVPSHLVDEHRHPISLQIVHPIRITL